jgi:hypothetical protein
MTDTKKNNRKYKQITVHLRESDLVTLDQWAAEATTTRSAMLRKMVDERKKPTK